MPAFTYIAKRSGGEWKAKRISDEEGDELSAEASSPYELQQELKKISVAASSGGPVQTLLSTISNDTLVFQVNVGGASFAAAAGGAAPAAAAASGGAAESKKEEKKEESEEEEDEDMGFSLFD